MKTLKINPSRLRKLSFGLIIATLICLTILFIALTLFLGAHDNQLLVGLTFLTISLGTISFISIIPLGAEGKDGEAPSWFLNKIIKRKFKKHNIKTDLIGDFLYYCKDMHFVSPKDNCVINEYILRKISKNTYEITSDPVSVFNNAFKASLSLKPHNFRLSERIDGSLILLDSNGHLK